MQAIDGLGVAWTATDDASVSAMDGVLEAYLGSRQETPVLLERLIDRDPDMPMARCLRAYLLKLAADPRFIAPLRKIRQQLETERAGLNDRERRHVDALAAWVDEDVDTALSRLELLLADYPRDIVALRIAHYLHFYAGAARDMRASVARSLSHWDAGMPFYGYVLGMHAFGLEESGDYDVAERVGREAVERNAGDVWAAHTVGHVMQMCGRFDEGIEWLSSRRSDWQGGNNFVYHMDWHLALFHYSLGNHDAALAIADETLLPAINDDFYLDACNAASLLWRLDAAGVDTGDRWQALADVSKARALDRELLFSTLHYVMTPARLRSRAVTRAALESLEYWSRLPTTQGRLCQRVGLPLARAIIDLGDGNFDHAAAALEALADDIVGIGGSNAQRELFDTLLHYAKRKSS